jgi:hypothetical protein
VTKPIHRIAACLAAAGAAHAGPAAAPSAPCLTTDAYAPICGLRAPEDLDTLDGSRLLVVQMRGMTGKGESNFAIVDTSTAAVRVLPFRDPSTPAAWGDGSCKAPDPHPAFHGFDRWTGSDGRVRVVVVNHGTRSTIERFALDGEGGEASLAWEGCVAVPRDIELNDVAALPDSGFAATVMGEARHFGNPAGLEFMLSGEITGHLVTWSATKGWQKLQGTRAAFPNGIVASPDGRTLWYAAWTGREVLRYDRATDTITGRVPLDYLPDNLSWSREGTILTAGIPDAASVRECVAKGAEVCDDAFEVSEIDPRAMTARTIANGPAGLIGGASVAVRLGDALYVGAFSGDRVLRIE